MIDKRDIFLKGKYTDLKILTESDIETSNWYGWFNDEFMMSGTQQHIFPNTKVDQYDILNEINSNNNTIQLGILPKESKKIIGIVALKNINFISRNADHSQIIEPENRNLGIVLESNKIIFDYAFNTLGLERINGGSIDKKQVEFMVRFYGFKHEGTLRKKVFKNGSFVDVFCIGLLKDEFRFLEINNES